MIYRHMEELIGNTPMFFPTHINEKFCKYGSVFVKLEMMNPAGSIKDRVALSMLNEAEKSGRIKPGATVIEPTSGNTGIGLAAIAAARGYRIILTMPDTMSAERRLLLAAYGAEIVLTPGADGMQGAVGKALELAGQIEGSFIPSQFDNPDNPRAHIETTGPEIWEQMERRVDYFVAGVGTGGTLTGTGRYLKEKNPACRVIAVEPASSPLLSKGYAGAHGLMGIGANFIPENLDRSLCDEILAVTEEEAYEAARQLVRSEGLLTGITSGAALHAAILIANRPETAGKNVVAILPDTGERYLSTPLYAEV